MAYRTELLDFLLNDLEMDPERLLHALVKQMSDGEFIGGMQYLSRVEDWRFRVVQGARVIDTEDNDKVVFHGYL